MSPHDFTGPATASTETEQEALIWLQLLTSGEPREWDVQRFRHWLQLDPAHRSTFNRVRQRMQRLGLPQAQAISSRAAPQRAPRGFKPGRRAWLGVAASAAMVAGVAAVYPPRTLWSALTGDGSDDQTGTGEQRTFSVDGSVSVTLNTQTSIRRQVVNGETVGLDLLDGEAAVDLKGGGRMFAVAVGAGRSVARGGRFEVRRLGDKVRVTCIAGALRIEHPAGTRQLEACQQTIYNDHALSGVAAIDPAQVSAWRRGELLFDQIRLAEVIDEINRYRPGRVILMNDAARSRKVNGRFTIASLDLALSQLQHAFGLASRALPGGILILS